MKLIGKYFSYLPLYSGWVVIDLDKHIFLWQTRFICGDVWY